MDRVFRRWNRPAGLWRSGLFTVLIALLAGACDGRSGNETMDHSNRLIKEKSPYLLQHAHNPVDWYPWGEEALQRAREEDKPIFLSIGYSTCHWCHVMEHESFENEEIADLMNRYFVCIKVDREERPDLDHLYMTAVQSMTGSGGWPLTVFLTPDLEPFYGGTYFPPDDRYGRPGMRTVIPQLGEAWQTSRNEIAGRAGGAADLLRRQSESLSSDSETADVSPDILDSAFASLVAGYDEKNGGFGNRPKFPTPHKLRFLMRYAKRTGNEKALSIARRTLDEMAMGGIHDQLAGGFHRYSTDDHWLVPHFEKMLYDQAGLSLAYTDAWLITGSPTYEAVTRSILDYVLNYMTDSAGGFYSAEDADSEGEEGKFYVWSKSDIDAILDGPTSDRFRKAYGVLPQGNWEGTNILHTDTLEPLLDPDLADARGRLLTVRDERVRPHLDDKIIVSWNGFMIEALAYAGRSLGEPRYIEAARRAASFIHEKMWIGGRLHRHYRDQTAPVLGYIDDYAYLGRGLLALYETTFDLAYLKEALHIVRETDRLFSRPDGRFDLAGTDSEKLIAPVVDSYDGALPSGNSAAGVLFLRLGHLTGDTEVEERGRRLLGAMATALRSSPGGFMELVSAADFALGPVTELVIAGEVGDPLVQSMWRSAGRHYQPNLVRVFHPTGAGEAISRLIPYVEPQIAIGGKATAYVCEDYACRLPIHDLPALVREMSSE